MNKFLYWLTSSNFLFHCHILGLRILLYTFLSKMFNCFLSLFVSVPVSVAYVNVFSVVVFFSLSFSFFHIFHLEKNRLTSNMKSTCHDIRLFYRDSNWAPPSRSDMH